MIFLFSYWRIILFSMIVLALGIQTGRIKLLKSEYAQEKAEIAVQEATERARIAHNAQETLDALQTRLTALDARYRVLRNTTTPSLVEATGIAEACPGEPSKPNPAVGQMELLERGIEEILKLGDKEIAKLVEIWELQQKNAAK